MHFIFSDTFDNSFIKNEIKILELKNPEYLIYIFRRQVFTWNINKILDIENNFY